jgi:MFS family permease
MENAGSRLSKPSTGSANAGRLSALLVSLAAVSTAVASLGAPLLPTIVAADHVSIAGSQWALTISLLTGAVATPVLGRLGDGRYRRAAILATVAAVTTGCALAAIPLGFAVLLAGRALQGLGLGLVPLATAVARDDLHGESSRRTIVLLGITTAAGVGLGYPLAGVLAQYLGLSAPFVAGAILSAVCLLAGAAVLPPSPPHDRHLDTVGAALLALGIAALLIAVAEAPTWGWSSPRIIIAGTLAVASLAAWINRELRADTPVVELRMLGRRSVLAGNLTGALVALGFYPLMSLVVRFVQTPPRDGYGLGASAVLAGIMLTPFSVASFAARRPAITLARRTSPGLLIATSTIAIAMGQLLFLTDRSGYATLIAAMALTGLGVGAVFAINPIQIIEGVPNEHTGSAISFYQLLRTVAYSIASALSATILVGYIPRGRALPANAGYSAAVLVDLAVLAAGLTVAIILALPQPLRRPRLTRAETAGLADQRQTLRATQRRAAAACRLPKARSRRTSYGRYRPK